MQTQHTGSKIGTKWVKSGSDDDDGGKNMAYNWQSTASDGCMVALLVLLYAVSSSSAVSLYRRFMLCEHYRIWTANIHSPLILRTFNLHPWKNCTGFFLLYDEEYRLCDDERVIYLRVWIFFVWISCADADADADASQIKPPRKMYYILALDV